MKTFCLVLLICLLFCTACTKKLNAPNFTNLGWETAYNNVLSLSIGYDETLSRSTSVSGMVYTKTHADTITLSIGDHHYVLTESFADWFSDGYIYSFDLDTLSIHPDSIYAYELKLPSKTYTGDLQLPSKPIVTFPGFSLTQDFSFQWTLLHMPDVQYVYSNIDAIDYENDISIWTRINKDARSYTIHEENFVNAYQYDALVETCKISDNTHSILTYGAVYSFKQFGPGKHVRKTDFRKLQRTTMRNMMGDQKK